MYDSLGWHGDSNHHAAIYARLESADNHEGDRARFVRRHKCNAKLAAKDPAKLFFLGQLLGKRVADWRNLQVAWDYLAHEGGTAPGPDGRRLGDFGRLSRSETLQSLSDDLKNGRYRTAKPRKVKIPKQGSGERTLALLNIKDRVAHRSILQIIQPVLDPSFEDTSYGFRPDLQRQHALAKALEWTRKGRNTWVVEDVRNAFDMVPRQRLLDIVRKRLPNAGDAWVQIEGAIHSSNKRGIPQGSPLSPLLLNLYLDHHLDKAWASRSPDTPLLRTADDLLVLCRSKAEAEDARELLRRLLTPAGMPLKGQQETAITSLTPDHPADWLGYSIHLQEQQPVIRIGERSWSRLEAKLAELHRTPSAPLLAPQVIQGWIAAEGVTYQHEDRDKVVGRIQAIAYQQSFEEIPNADDLLEYWQRAYARWCKLERQTTSGG